MCEGGDYVVELAKLKKNRKKVTIFLLFLIIVSICGLKIYYNKALKPMNSNEPKEITIDIPAGSSTKRIGNILEENNLIKSKLVFEKVVKDNNLDGQLKAGTYVLSTAMDLKEIVDKLKTGSKGGNTVTFTIPEGYEIKDIADKLYDLELINKEVFLELTSNVKNFSDKYSFLKELSEDQSLEGFLFPDTYEVYEDTSEEEIINRMLSRFEKFYESELKEEIKKTDLDLNEITTLASIIEREARVDKERPIISGVYYNRLEKDMLLQADATVQYALGKRKERLLYKDLEIESPYNTYIHKGLPPAPIASPGEKSLIAAVKPSNVDYLYYVLKKDGSGEHIFSKTYEEHLRAKSKN